jgi:hypothetical protein
MLRKYIEDTREQTRQMRAQLGSLSVGIEKLRGNFPGNDVLEGFTLFQTMKRIVEELKAVEDMAENLLKKLPRH